jgi:ubiquinone/menaquinone biosynthesis C-methylase UbiE
MGDRGRDQQSERLPARGDHPLIDPAAATFERVAAEYDYGRPSWPPEAVASVGLPRDADVADLGAGTGKLTWVLLDQFDRVIAIEPLDGMRALIPAEAQVIAGTAEAIPLADGSMDAVFCGESFHWFDWPRALPEIARVLRPGGALAMFWNRGETSWSPAVQAILDRVSHSPGEKRYQAYAWRDAFEGSSFEPLRHEVFPHEADVATDVLIARIGSWSNFTIRSPDERQALLAEIRSHLTEPSYRDRLETHAWTTRRLR